MKKTLYINKFLAGIKKTKLMNALNLGASKYGYDVKFVGSDMRDVITERDVLVIWNRHNDQDEFAKRFESVGAKVLCFENPYVDVYPCEYDYYSVGFGFHNNIDLAPQKRDSGERWKSFNREIKEWKKETHKDHYILVCTQSKVFNGKGLGFGNFAQPEYWDENILNHIKSVYPSTPIKFRQNPKSKQNLFNEHRLLKHNIKLSTDTKNWPLLVDLYEAKLTVVYTSNSATESLLFGVPVAAAGPNLYTKSLCSNSITNILYPTNRQEVFERMAWSQYNIQEIETGYFFECLDLI